MPSDVSSDIAELQREYPESKWFNTEFRSYVFDDESAAEARLIETAESK
jgi:hypothetical protein